MVHVLTPLTLRLAEAIGLYMTAAGILLLTRPGTIADLLPEIARSPALAFLAGALGWAIGTALLIAHHVTADPLALVVTLVGWLSLAEGLALIALPGPFVALVSRMAPGGRVWGLVALVLGVVLFLAGLTGRADYIPQGAI